MSLENIPQAVAAIVGQHINGLIGTETRHDEKQKKVVELVDKLTRTMARALLETEHNVAHGLDDTGNSEKA